MKLTQQKYSKKALTAILIVCAISVSSCSTYIACPPDPRASETCVINDQLFKLYKTSSDNINYSVWLGKANGGIWFQHNTQQIMPAASAIKSAILIEFFDLKLSSLDSPFIEASDIIGNSDSPAISHFNGELIESIQSELKGLTARELAQAMIHKKHVQSNAAYNAATNVVIEYLGGPKVVTKLIHNRISGSQGIVVDRYMLADRQENGDNLLTAESLAAVLRFIAGNNSNNELLTSVSDVLWLETDKSGASHYYKGGSLSSTPQVRIKAGWWDKEDSGFIYVVIATNSSTNSNREDFDAMSAELTAFSELIQQVGFRILDTQ